MSVGISVLILQKEAYIFSGKAVGLTRACRRFHYLYHLPQIVLKSQY